MLILRVRINNVQHFQLAQYLWFLFDIICFGTANRERFCLKFVDILVPVFVVVWLSIREVHAAREDHFLHDAVYQFASGLCSFGRGDAAVIDRWWVEIMGLPNIGSRSSRDVRDE